MDDLLERGFAAGLPLGAVYSLRRADNPPAQGRCRYQANRLNGPQRTRSSAG
jgi:hypothetical protein